MTETQKAYIAGLFDGEGSVGVHAYQATKNGRKYLRLQLRITNTDRACLDFVKVAHGRGCVTRSHKARGKWKECFSYIALGSAAVCLAKEIEPYLVIKRQKVLTLVASRNSGRA